MTVDKNMMEMEQQDDVDTILAAYEEQRRDRMYGRNLPRERTMECLLTIRTKEELEDIAYNLNLENAEAMSKDQLVSALPSVISSFARQWLTTAIDEEYECFSHLMQSGGFTTSFHEVDLRLDYLCGLGFFVCGMRDGKLTWTLPVEIQREFEMVDSPAYEEAVRLNTEIVRIATGLLFYYGYLDFDQLYQKVMEQMEDSVKDTVTFYDFLGIMLNVSCWKNTLIASKEGMKYYMLVDEKALEEKVQKLVADYAVLEYPDIYDAGDTEYIAATDEYKAFAQYLMHGQGLDVLLAANVVEELYIALQNDQSIAQAEESLKAMGYYREEDSETIRQLLSDYDRTMRKWSRKGHTANELGSAVLNRNG